MLRWIALFAVVVACTSPSLAAAETARGRVFLDADGDGVFDPSETPLAGVAVSNGHDVVETDANGSWELTVRDGDVLFVTKPSGYRTALDENHIPRFYTIHDPDGSDSDLRFPGVDPTGDLPASIDFALTEQDENADFEVILFADTQPQSHAELDYVRDDVVADLVGTSAAFGMTLGDIVYDDMSLFPRYLDIVGEIGAPWYHVPGNHELNFLSTDDAGSRETFKRFLGPNYYSFDYARAHFVVIDDIQYEGHPTESLAENPRGRGSYYGGLDERQLDWLAADLARVPDDRLVVVAMHIPFRSTIEADAPNANVFDRERLFEILSRRPHLLAVAGHMHVVEHHYFGREDDFARDEPLHLHTVTTVSGSWWGGPRDERGIPSSLQRDGTPNGWSVLEVSGTDAKVRYRAASFGPEYQMRIGFDRSFHQLGPYLLRDYRPGELSAGGLLVEELASTDVFVNLFNGGPRSQVSMRIDDGDWIEMEREYRDDPFAAEHFLRYEHLMKSWVECVDTSHLWVAPMPSVAGSGAHTVTVRAIDEYGAEHRARRVFEVR